MVAKRGRGASADERRAGPPVTPPARLAAIEAETRALGFTMACDAGTGSLLRTLAAGRPGGCILEVGTGTGHGTSWLLDGMDRDATLVSVDTDEAVLGVARRHLGDDPRLTLRVADGGGFLVGQRAEGRRFDLVFADAWPGKYTHLDVALGLVAVGGLYVVDDLLPQPSWPEGHGARAAALVETLSRHPDFHATYLAWSTGLFLATRRREARAGSPAP